MTNLTDDPSVISLVQVAGGLPMFLFAMPAGALTDIVDKRTVIITGIAISTVLSAIFSALVSFHQATPPLLLLFVFLIGAGGAMTAPAWQSIVPTLVPKADLAPAVAANSVGINISRAIGPALGGAVIAALGIAAPFWFNTLSNLATLGAIIWWRSPQKPAGNVPAERFMGALRTGLRHARHNPQLRSTLIRALAFFPFAAAYWALLPSLTRSQIIGGPQLYGVLLGAIGGGALAATTALPWLKARIGVDWIVRAASVSTAFALILFGIARDPIIAVFASLISGASWIAVMASLNVSAQVALPNWVRGRGLALFVTLMFAGLTLGSALWGQLAAKAGLPIANFAAAFGLSLAIPLTWRWHLQGGLGDDLTPSTHWPIPIPLTDVEQDKGPVLVTVEYRIAAQQNRDPFLRAIYRLAPERGRDGAYSWSIFEDTAVPGLFLEIFQLDSWLEHLRQHERVTNADRILQNDVHGLLDGPPRVRHLIASK